MTTHEGDGPNGCDGCWGFRTNVDVDANGQAISPEYPCPKCRPAEFEAWRCAQPVHQVTGPARSRMFGVYDAPDEARSGVSE